MDGMVVAQDGSCTTLVKLNRTVDALQRVVSAVDRIGATITAMTARRSLDGEIYYLTLELAHAPEAVRVDEAIRTVPGVRGVEVKAHLGMDDVALTAERNSESYRVDFGRAYS